MIQIPELDWKVLSALRSEALNRFCYRILRETEALSMDEAKTPHERYLEVFSHINERDDDIALLFNGHSRSRALERLMSFRQMDLITDEEFLSFSEEARSRIDGWLKARELARVKRIGARTTFLSNSILF